MPVSLRFGVLATGFAADSSVGPEMVALYSARTRHSTWREMWLWLAEGEKELGLDISDEALAQMRAHLRVTDEDFATAAVEEKRRRHDVMAHVHAFGQVAPAAAGIIHLGATSCFVTDGTEQILQRRAFDLLLPKVAGVIHNLTEFATQYKNMPCLAHTHGQPAQPTTVGKRAACWIYDLLKDVTNLERARDDITFRGAKGTTGTQASYLGLFGGDHEKVRALDHLITRKAGFSGPPCPVTTQTYSRKQDLDVAHAFASLAASVQKITGDLRHLAMFKEMEEPFEAEQIGSSAMAYKRNPMRSERAGSLARELMGKAGNAAATFASQWLERTLDDSAVRRIDLPEMNLLADAILRIMDNVTAGLVVYPAVIAKHLMEELPFMATEPIIMALSAKGVSRQDAHERIRIHSQAASDVMKNEGKANDELERIRGDEFFAPAGDVDALMAPSKFVGRAPQQVEDFIEGWVDKALAPYQKDLEGRAKVALHV